MGHSSSEGSDFGDYRSFNHAERMERKRRKRMLKHARRNPGLLPVGPLGYVEPSPYGLIGPGHHGGYNPGLLPIGPFGYAESSHHGLIGPGHHGGLGPFGYAESSHHGLIGPGHHGGYNPSFLPVGPLGYAGSSHHGLIDRPGRHGYYGGRRPGLISSLIGTVASALTSGHQRSRSAPPVPDLNNNQPGYREAGQYVAPEYPPPDQARGSGPFPEPGYSSLDQQPRSFPDDQFEPYKTSRSDDKSGGSPQEEYGPPPGPPPAYSRAPQSAPPSGFRVPLNTTTDFFPPSSNLGTPPCFNTDGSPLYFASALFPRSVHPCKVSNHLGTQVLVAYGGREQSHSGRYDLLPFSSQTMELVRTSGGRIPPGRRPVEGGHEENEAKLYHAVATLQGVKVPGKTGSHLGGAIVGFEGEQLVVTDDYEILCWK